MKITQRIARMVRANKADHAQVSAGGTILSDLEKHRDSLSERINGISLARHLLFVERNSWPQLQKEVENRKSRTNDPMKLASLERLQKIADATAAKYADNSTKLDDKLNELRDIQGRINSAITMIEVENNLRSVTAMFEGETGQAHSEFNLDLETREIQRLLHSADGLLEIMS